MDDNTVVKPYQFRKLCAEDLFPLAELIGKIGLDEFTKCFQSDSVKTLIANMSFEGAEDGGKNTALEANINMAGIGVMLEIGNVIIKNLSRSKSELYTLLSGVSGLPVKTIKAFDLEVFLEMIFDFVRKEEFHFFIKVASKLFK